MVARVCTVVHLITDLTLWCNRDINEWPPNDIVMWPDGEPELEA